MGLQEHLDMNFANLALTRPGLYCSLLGTYMGAGWVWVMGLNSGL
jgi:hypothetical protein